MVQHVHAIAIAIVTILSLSDLFARLSRLLHTQTEFFRGVGQAAVVFARRVRLQVCVCWTVVVIII
jgi:hypothetical protein